MLRIIITMFEQVFKFLFIWSIVLFCQASVASILFGELPNYIEFFDVCLEMFGTGLGNYDLSVFENLSIGSKVGEVYIIFCLLVNSIIMVNFIIAILADTYTKLTAQSLGLYYDGLIAQIPLYEDDNLYGGLIVGVPPFHMFALPMIPFYLIVKDE